MILFFAAIGWLICSVTAGLAVFSPTIKDTILERIGLSGISICALGVSYKALIYDEITPGGIMLGLSVGGYCLAVLLKHMRALYVQHRYLPYQ